MQQLLSSLEAERQRQFRRFVGVSAVFHVLFALAFWIGPIRRSGPALPAVVRVNLVEALDSAPAARPAPTALPKPPPPPPPVAKKVLPKQPAPLPKPKPAVAKPKPKEAKPEPKPKEPAPEQELDDVLAQLRKESGETAPKPLEQVAAPMGGPAGGPGIVVDAETARWMREVKIHVTRAWILAPGFRTEALVTIVEVELSPTGDVLGTETRQSSGNPWYDESVERAIQKASPVPAPPEAGEWQFTFDSRDM